MKQGTPKPGLGLSTLGDKWRFLITRYLVVSSIPLIVAHLMTMGMGLLRNALLANYLTKEDYGALSYLYNWLPLVALLGLPGLNVAVAQYVARGHWEAIRAGLRRALFFSPLPMIMLLAFALIGIQTKHGHMMTSLWVFTALFFPTAQVLGLVANILGALRRFRRLGVYYVGRSAAFLLAAAMGLWFWPGQTLGGIVLFQWLLISLLNVWFWAHLNPPKTGSIPLSPPQRSQFYRFGRHMTVLTAIGQVQTHIGALLLGSLVNLSALAEYTIGALFFEQMRGLWSIYHSVSYPRILTLGAPDGWRQVRREALWVTPACAALAGGVGLSLSFLIPWLFSVKYAASLPYVWILLLAFVCSIPGGFFEMYFRVQESERALYRIRLLSAAAGVLLPSSLLLLWGPLGVPTGRAGSAFVYSVVGFILYRRQRQ